MKRYWLYFLRNLALVPWIYYGLLGSLWLSNLLFAYVIVRWIFLLST